jgi:lysozyme family protein
LNFDKAVEVILKHEGGYVNDPVDPGGETNMGISKRAYPYLNIKELTKKDAKDIYFKDYWLKAKCSKLPEELRMIYFDMVVNMGKSRAVKILQKAITAKGVKTAVDGGIGPQTISNALKSGLEPDRLRSYRVKYYADLIGRKPKLEKYWFGWYRRALQV